MYTVEVKVGILTEDTTIHTWIHITKPDGSEEAFGFYPATDDLSNIVQGEGEVRSEDVRKDSNAGSGQLSMTQEQYDVLKDYIMRTTVGREGT